MTEWRPPHPATLPRNGSAQAKIGSPGPPPHPATVVQARTPHPATVAQPKRLHPAMVAQHVPLLGPSGSRVRSSAVQRAQAPRTKLYDVNILSWNTQGKKDDIFRTLVKMLKDFDVICLQECTAGFAGLFNDFVETYKESKNKIKEYLDDNTKVISYTSEVLAQSQGSDLTTRTVYKDLVMMIKTPWMDKTGVDPMPLRDKTDRSNHQARNAQRARFGDDLEIWNVHLNSGANSKNKSTLADWTKDCLVPTFIIGDQNIKSDYPDGSFVVNYFTRPKSWNTLDFAITAGPSRLDVVQWALAGLATTAGLDVSKLSAKDPNTYPEFAQSDHLPVGYTVTVNAAS